MRQTIKLVPGGKRLSDADAQVKYLRTREGARAMREHDENIAREALKATQRMTGKLAPVYPTLQTRVRRSGFTLIELLVVICAVAGAFGIGAFLVFLLFRLAQG